MSAEADCPFCAFASGEREPEHLVASGPEWLAFFPLKPATLGHTLVIPREHHVDLWELPSGLRDELVAAAVRVGQALRIALEPEGLNLITSAGAAAEQTVFHMHLHVVPRWQRDAFGEIWPEHGTTDTAALPALAERLGGLLAQ